MRCFSMPLTEYIPDQIWLVDYPVQYSGCRFEARMTVIRLLGDRLLLHSPGPIDVSLRTSLEQLGKVRYLVAPGYYHYSHVAAAQNLFPQAETFLCPGLERKCPNLACDWILGPRPPAAWADELDQVLVQGCRFMWEVVFLHQPSRTLILVDLIENFSDRTPHTNWVLQAWWRIVFRMWNRPKPAPEYQLGWQHRAVVQRSLSAILNWEFDRIILAHGDLIESQAKAQARLAWTPPLPEMGQSSTTG
jgi:hypothetical protein